MSKRSLLIVTLGATFNLLAQLPDKTTAPNLAGEGIAKSYTEQIGPGRGDLNTPNSSLYVIRRDPFRSVRRGRQIFQRKFTHAQGQGPGTGDGTGDINADNSIGAGLTDSCAACHGRPRGAAGSGGDVVTHPDSRDAPHLFGLGLKEMLGDEITTDLRAIRTIASTTARAFNQPVTLPLMSKGIRYGSIKVQPNGTVDTSQVKGVNPDLRVRPFFHHGGTISIREFLIGAFNNEMGMEAYDPDTAAAAAGAIVTTPAGMVLDGTKDKIDAPPAASASADPDHDGKTNEVPVSIVDHMEFYLLHYFKPATYEQTHNVDQGRRTFDRIGCTSCHMQQLVIDKDRRVADMDTEYDAQRGIMNHLFATAVPQFSSQPQPGGADVKVAQKRRFVVDNIFADFRRHDLGPNFWERNFDGTFTKEFMTEPLWGVGTTAPYGHDGRSINLTEVILRHGGEAQNERNNFAQLPDSSKSDVLEFLNSLVLFPPDDTASTLNPGDKTAPNFPQNGHGSIRLTTLFNNPADPE